MINKFVVLNENELASVANTIMDYSRNLLYAIESFEEIMLLLQDNGIKDVRISNELNRLSTEVQAVLPELNYATEGVLRDIRAFMEEVKREDIFNFPEDVVNLMVSKLNIFD